MAKYTLDIDVNYKSVEDLQSELKALEAEFSTLSIGSEGFVALGNQIKNIKSQLKDVELQFEGLDKEQRATALVDTFNGLTGAVGAVSSAFIAFGAESQAIEDAEKKLLGVIGVVNGLRDVSNSLVAANKLLGPSFTTLGNSIKTAFTSGTVAAQTFKAALAALGIGALIAGITALVTNYDSLKEAITGVNEEEVQLNKNLAETIKELNKTASAAKIAASVGVNELQNAFNDIVNTGGDATAIFSDIQKQLPELSNLSLDAAGAQDKVNAALNRYNNLRGYQVEVEQNNIAISKLVQEQTEKVNAGVKGAFEAYQLRINAIRETNTELNKNIAVIQSQRQVEIDAATAAKKAAAEREAAAKAAEAERKRAAEELKNRVKEIGLDYELLGKSVEEKELILAKREFDARVKGLKQNSEAYQQALALFKQKEADITKKAADDRVKAEQDAAQKIKDAAQKEFQDTLASVTTYYTERLTLQKQALLNGEITQQQFDAQALQIELEKNQSLLTATQDYGQSTAEVNSAIADAQIAISTNVKDTEVANQEAIKAAKQATLDATSQILGSLAGLAEEGSAASKAFGLAQIGVDTAIALTNAQASAFSPASPDNAVTGGAAGVAKYLTYAAIILSNVAKAKAILSSGGKGGGGSFGGGAKGGAGLATIPSPITTTQGSFTPTLPKGMTNPAGGAQTGGFGPGTGNIPVVKTYVLSGDVTTAQQAEAQINQKRKF